MYTTYNVKVRIICKKYMYMDSNNYEFKSDKTGIHTTISGAYVIQCISETQLQLHVYRCVCVHVTSTCMASCTRLHVHMRLVISSIMHVFFGCVYFVISDGEKFVSICLDVYLRLMLFLLTDASLWPLLFIARIE